jgi:hypothetical protein
MQSLHKLSKITALILLAGTSVSANANTEAKTTIDLNLRYEAVDQDNALKDASALTLRTRLNHTTASYNGFSAVVEFEDSRQVLGVDSYNDATGNNTQYSTVIDPESTELDQAYVQYKQDKVTAKVGRQVITLDNHRFVGHVGWRQDRQTFDALSIGYVASDSLKGSYSYITKRNRIFGEVKDVQSKDHLLNLSYKTDYGQLTAYSYLLEVDNTASNGLDTYGVSFKGKKDKFSYYAEFATQDSDGTTDYSATYMAFEGGYSFDKVNVKLGAEVLGSDDAMYGFATPLATLHKFNGWSDQFAASTPKEGLVDLYAEVSGKAFGGGWKIAYHDFSADESTSTVDDLGSEINAVYAKKFGKNYKAGIKYAAYSAGDIKVDTDKVWVWVSAKF